MRISPDNPHTIELAFTLAMLGKPTSFATGAWAGSNASLNPTQFDFNDHMTHILVAGDPDPSLTQVYPLKGLSEIDNTCRLAVGFAAGREPGLCTIFIPKQPGEPAAPTLPPILVGPG